MDIMCQEEGFAKVHGVLFDVGFSSWQIQESGRGFSFLKNEALDMRYEPDPEHISAYEVVNSYAKNDLERVLFEYGEEKRAHQIVQQIVRIRRKNHIQTTGDLVNIVSQVVKARPGMSPATKTFQALRIEVNNEIRTLEKGLSAAMSIIGNKGRIVVISFHSLEDRTVKHTFQRWKQQGRGDIMTKKVITPHFTEVQRNRRSRSAKLRTFSVIKH